MQWEMLISTSHNTLIYKLFNHRQSLITDMLFDNLLFKAPQKRLRLIPILDACQSWENWNHPICIHQWSKLDLQIFTWTNIYNDIPLLQKPWSSSSAVTYMYNWWSVMGSKSWSTNCVFTIIIHIEIHPLGINLCEHLVVANATDLKCVFYVLWSWKTLHKHIMHNVFIKQLVKIIYHLWQWKEKNHCVLVYDSNLRCIRIDQ